MSHLIEKHGGYKKLLSYKIALIVYDITVRFCERYISKKSRTYDQMVQAARSGVQNIAEGSQDSATSKKIEIKLTQIARGSLEELKNDYRDFLRQNNLPQWENTDPRWKSLIERKCNSADEVAAWVKENCIQAADHQNPKKLYPEYSANAAIILTQVVCSLINRQVARLAKDFAEKGGFTEKMYRIRKEKRDENR
ncbi:MAG: four helix bundle suffix domain-containing protein [Candidatus Cloacimonetes bacterium]|nr:four helix bundle suffix domain-containing protein [Candidatus Cloacimonadota bacterium]